MLTINGETYLIDLDKIGEVIEIENKENKQFDEVVDENWALIGEGAKAKLTLIEKNVSKQPHQRKIDPTKFETINYFINVLCESQNDTEGGDFDFTKLSFGEKLAFNTLLQKKILRKL
jgi:hypothetical protein